MELTNKFFSAIIRFFAYIHCPLIGLRFLDRFMFRAIVDAIALRQPIILKYLIQHRTNDPFYIVENFYQLPLLIGLALHVEDTAYLSIILDNHTSLRVFEKQQKDIFPIVFCRALKELYERNSHASAKHMEVLFSALRDYSRQFFALARQERDRCSDSVNFMRSP